MDLFNLFYVPRTWLIVPIDYLIWELTFSLWGRDCDVHFASEIAETQRGYQISQGGMDDECYHWNKNLGLCNFKAHAYVREHLFTC